MMRLLYLPNDSGSVLLTIEEACALRTFDLVYFDRHLRRLRMYLGVTRNDVENFLSQYRATGTVPL